MLPPAVCPGAPKWRVTKDFSSLAELLPFPRNILSLLGRRIFTKLLSGLGWRVVVLLPIFVQIPTQELPHRRKGTGRDRQPRGSWFSWPSTNGTPDTTSARNTRSNSASAERPSHRHKAAKPTLRGEAFARQIDLRGNRAPDSGASNAPSAQCDSNSTAKHCLPLIAPHFGQCM